MNLSEVVSNRLMDIYITNGIEHEVVDCEDNYLWTFRDPLSRYHFRFVVEKGRMFVEDDHRDQDLLHLINQAVTVLLEDRKLSYGGDEK